MDYRDGCPLGFDDMELLADTAADVGALWISMRPRDLVRLLSPVQVLRTVCESLGVDVVALCEKGG